jgi:hypothetical protein
VLARANKRNRYRILIRSRPHIRLSACQVPVFVYRQIGVDAVAVHAAKGDPYREKGGQERPESIC